MFIEKFYSTILKLQRSDMFANRFESRYDFQMPLLQSLNFLEGVLSTNILLLTEQGSCSFETGASDNPGLLPGLAFTQPNLPFLIQEIIARLLA